MEGENWETVHDGVVLSLAARDTLLYAGTDSGISMSDDQGQTWRDLPCPPIHDLRHLYIYKERPLLAGAYSGIIHYTGSSWDTLPNLPQVLTMLAIGPDDTLFLSSIDGLMRLAVEEMEGKEKQKGHDTSFPHERQVLLEGLDGQVNFMTFRCNGSSWQAWAVSEDGTRLLHSNDEGATWQSLQSPSASYL